MRLHVRPIGARVALDVDSLLSARGTGKPKGNGGDERGDENAEACEAHHGYPPCCQQYLPPALACREHCVPFLVIAWHRPDSAARSVAAAFGEALTAGAAGAVVSPGTRGLQILHGPYLPAACERGMGIELLRNELHPAR